MRWTDWVTLVIAVLGAGLGVFNAVIAYGRGRPQIALEAHIEQGADGSKRLMVKLINTGAVPVLIENLFIRLRGHPGNLTQMAFRAYGFDHHWKGKQLAPGNQMEVGGAVGSANILNDPCMRLADSFLLKLAGRKPIRYKSQVLTEAAAHARLKGKFG